MKRINLPVSYLLEEAQRINLIRWIIMGVGGLVLLFLAPFTQTFFGGLLLLGISLLLGWGFRLLYRSAQKNQARDPVKAGQRLRFYFGLQFLLEAPVILFAIHLSGGPLSPLVLLYILYVGMLAVVFPTRLLVIMTAYVVLTYSVLMETYIRGWWLPELPFESLAVVLTPQFMRGFQVVFLLTLIFSSILVAARARQLHNAWADATEKSEFLDRLNELARQSLTSTDMKALCQILADQIGSVLLPDSAYINAWDEDTQTSVNIAAYGPLRESYAKMRIPAGMTATASMRRMGGPLIIEDVRNSPYVSPEVASQFPTRSMLTMPIYGYPDRIYWGAILIAYHGLHQFSPEEIQRAQQVADIIALLISRVRLYQETLSRAELLGEFSLQVTRLTSDLRHTTLLPGIVESARSLLKAQRAALFLRDTNQDRLLCSHAIGLSDEYIQGINAHSRPALEEEIFAENAVLVPDVMHDPRSTTLQAVIIKEGFLAYGIFALTSPDGTRGALAVYWDQVHAISSEEIATARLFAERASDVLHNADLYAQVTEQSLTDDLTGLPNRRALDKQMVHESARSFRFGRPFTLVMMDLDGFKSINDNFGHPMGDSVLQQVAATLRRSVRTTDFVARYGGDEFAVILPETDLDSACTVVDKLRMALASCNLRLPNATQRYVSACMGMAAFPSDTTVPDKLLEIADKRLYQAKNTQNGTIVAGG